MHILIAPDSYKGSLTATAAAQAMAEGVRRVCPDARVTLMPMTDGGEGMLELVLGLHDGSRAWFAADNEPGRFEYGRVRAGADDIMVIESAGLLGLSQPAMGERLLEARTSRHLGALIRYGMDCGYRRFWVGLGGTATNDGGAGMLAALGVRFEDARGRLLAAAPQTLRGLCRADFSGLDARLKDCRIDVLADVTNPLAGRSGATRVYGPQKGARPDQVAWLDALLGQLGRVGDAWCGQSLAEAPGSGAAGGLGFAFRLLGADVRSGAAWMLDRYGFAETVQQCDWVVTGEGCSDLQTLQGKVPQAVANLARFHHVPVALISGQVEDAARSRLSAMFDYVATLVTTGVTPELAKQNAAVMLALRTEQWLQHPLQYCR